MKLKYKIVLFTMTCLLAASACQNKLAESRKDPLDENYKLIDRGSYSEAIESLKELSLRDPRPQVQVALGSAYAARGGIKVDQYWGFVIGFQSPLVKEEKPKDLSVWDQYKGRLEAIPVVSDPKALKDLHHAVDTLAAVPTPGGRLYRAILNLILFKSYMVSSNGFWEKFGGVVPRLLDGDTAALCEFDLDQLLNWLNPIAYHMIETMKDLTIAFPENEEDFTGARNLIQAVFATTKDAVKELREQRTCE